MSEKLVFAFDVGTGSLGLAARRGNKMLEARSLLLDEDYGKRDEQRKIIRAFRTRKAHLAREKYLQEVCKQAGIPVLKGREDGKKGDPRLEREFPKRGDSTVYNSALLRIMLLRGEKLEPWQVYKALHSAIQRRGFDQRVPWKDRASRKGENEEDSQTAESASAYRKEVTAAVGEDPRFQYPCYFAAYQMGLWDPKTDKIRLRIDHKAKGVRNYIIPRDMVEKEIADLLKAASRQFPRLEGREMRIIYGPAARAYASYYPETRSEYGLKEGGENDWQGLLGQKIPRFDNRLPAPCALIPRFNVARSNDIAIYEATFLMKIKNIRFYRDHLQNNDFQESALTVEEIGQLLKEARQRAKDARRNGEPEEHIAAAYSLNKTEWKKWLKKNGHAPMSTHPCVEAPSTTGRSRYSRPAARLIRELVLSGQSPADFYKTVLPLCGKAGTPYSKLLQDDLIFLRYIKGEWQNIYIPILPLSGDWSGKSTDIEAIREQIKKLIGAQRNVLVVHRIGLFYEQLERMISLYGTPDEIIMEFIREDFMGEEAKKKLQKFQNENRKAWDQARSQAKGLNLSGGGNVRKLRMLREQNFICPYTGDTLSENEVDTLEVEHIVPRARGGSDNQYNKVVTRSGTNREKGDRTPYEWLTQKGTFAAFCERVEKMGLSRKKKEILTAKDPFVLDQKWDSLAETAYIARVARDVAALRCGWQPGEAGEQKHIHVINGANTAKVRGLYHLNSLLAPDQGGLEPDKFMKKVRENKKHHALDAMVLSFIREWIRNPKTRQYEFPSGVDRNYFQQCLETVVPYNCVLPKASLQETFYGTRLLDGEKTVVVRTKITELGVTFNKFDQKKAAKEAGSIIDPFLKKAIIAALNSREFKLNEWQEWCQNFRHPRTGARVLKVQITAQKPDTKEYVNMAKEGEENGFRGQYKLGAQHQGYFIYLEKDKKGNDVPKVCPVYAFHSRRKVEEELKAQGLDVIGFFQSKCLVEFLNDYEHGSIVIPAGKYILSTIRADGRFELAGIPKCPLSKIRDIRHSFHRVDDPDQ
jgi:CRISPR-associated endonuclease Csn1